MLLEYLIIIQWARSSDIIPAQSCEAGNLQLSLPPRDPHVSAFRCFSLPNCRRHVHLVASQQNKHLKHEF